MRGMRIVYWGVRFSDGCDPASVWCPGPLPGAWWLVSELGLPVRSCDRGHACCCLHLLAKVSKRVHHGDMATLNMGSLGEYIRDQRRHAQYSLRQLADVAGVSNPYLSQIERGLRKPSADILQQIAKALRISAEQLYVRAGILEDNEENRASREVEAAILNDGSITERQKQVLLEIYDSFRRERAATAEHQGQAEPAATEA